MESATMRIQTEETLALTFLRVFSFGMPLQVTLNLRGLYMFNLKHTIAMHFCVCLRIQNSKRISVKKCARI